MHIERKCFERSLKARIRQGGKTTPIRRTAVREAGVGRGEPIQLRAPLKPSVHHSTLSCLDVQGGPHHAERSVFRLANVSFSSSNFKRMFFFQL